MEWNIVYINLVMLVIIRQAKTCDFRYMEEYDGIFADCKGRGLLQIPQNLSKEIVALDLSDNFLSKLPENALFGLPNLTFLNLNNNTIKRMDKEAMKGLSKLRTLFLARNQLSNNRTYFPDGIFTDLHNLKTLNLEKNKITSYPDWAFPPLVNLESLYIDSLPSPVLGPGFMHLKKLKRLQMDSRHLLGGKCVVERLKNETFYNVRNSQLKVLVLNHCHMLTSCEYGVFEPLTSLTTLKLSRNQIGIQVSLRILHSFTGRTMNSIILNAVHSNATLHISDVSDRSLTNVSAQYLKQICVSEFSMNTNNLIWLSPEALFESQFSKCVEKLDLSKNILMGDIRILGMFSLLPRLKMLKIGYQYKMYAESSVTTTISADMETVSIENFQITLPESLEYSDLSGIMAPKAHSLFELTFRNSTNLNTFIFGYNKMDNLVRIRGLETVTDIDMSGNSFHNFKGILASFPGATSLVLRKCKLQFSKSNSRSDVFASLFNVVRIDLSHNTLRDFPNLPAPWKISEFNLSYNELDCVPLIIDNYKNLTTLDLSHNMIGQIESNIRSLLDIIYERNRLRVLVEGNPFVCGCKNLDFILWLVESPVVYETDRNFTCIQEDGTMAGTVDVAWNYVGKSRQCNGKFILSITVSLLTVLFTCLITGYFLAKNLTRFSNALLKLFGLGINILTPVDFVFTLYIGYCSCDIPFVFRELRPAFERMKVFLFLKDREVLPGVDIADGIIQGVNNSWKTLLVVSHNFLQDPWSNFTINTVVYSMTDLIPDRIIVLLVDDVQVEDLPETLLNAVDEECILHAGDFYDKPELLCKEIIKKCF